MPWKARRDGPPHTTTSPCRSGSLRGRSLRVLPPNRNTAGRPSDTETMGASSERSSRSWCSDSRAPGS
jgi:hypothetical protein